MRSRVFGEEDVAEAWEGERTSLAATTCWTRISGAHGFRGANGRVWRAPRLRDVNGDALYIDGGEGRKGSVAVVRCSVHSSHCTCPFPTRALAEIWKLQQRPSHLLRRVLNSSAGRGRTGCAFHVSQAGVVEPASPCPLRRPAPLTHHAPPSIHVHQHDTFWTLPTDSAVFCATWHGVRYFPPIPTPSASAIDRYRPPAKKRTREIDTRNSVIEWPGFARPPRTSRQLTRSLERRGPSPNASLARRARLPSAVWGWIVDTLPTFWRSRQALPCVLIWKSNTSFFSTARDCGAAPVLSSLTD